MAKVALNGIADIERKIQQTFLKVKKSEQMTTEIGDFVVTRIRAEARRGKPLNDTRTFPPLKETTKIIREALAVTNDTHPTFKVNRSNLTFSGQLIEAIKYRIRQDGTISIRVANTTRRRYKSPFFQRSSKRDLLGEMRKFARGGAVSRTKKFMANAREQQNKTNREVDRDLRKRGFVLYTAKGIDSEQRIKKRINNIVKKFVRRAIKVNFES